jgi:hypothetical protein
MQGDIKARRITVEGTVDGDLYALDSVVLRAGAIVRGNVFANKVSVAEGAKFSGRIDMDNAPTVPNVTARTTGGSDASGEHADLTDQQSASCSPRPDERGAGIALARAGADRVCSIPRRSPGPRGQQRVVERRCALEEKCGSARPAKHPRRQHDDCTQQPEQAVDGDPEESERQQEQPTRSDRAPVQTIASGQQKSSRRATQGTSASRIILRIDGGNAARAAAPPRGVVAGGPTARRRMRAVAI